MVSSILLETLGLHLFCTKYSACQNWFYNSFLVPTENKYRLHLCLCDCVFHCVCIQAIPWDFWLFLSCNQHRDITCHNIFTDSFLHGNESQNKNEKNTQLGIISYY